MVCQFISCSLDVFTLTLIAMSHSGKRYALNELDRNNRRAVDTIQSLTVISE